MPFLKEQVQIVNDALIGLVFNDARFKSGRFETLATDVSRKESDGSIKTFPAVMNENYEAIEITPDDTYPIVIYHKAVEKVYEPDKFQAGDTQRYQVERSIVKMVVYGKYAALKLTKEQLEALITSNFPDQIPASKIQPLKLDNMTVTLRTSNLNTAQVFSEEYKGYPLFLAPEDILFSVKYSIDTKFRKGCIKVCDCN